MKSLLPVLVGLFALVTSLGASPTPTRTTAASTFTYNATAFLLNGEPFQIIGGQMDPQRIPPQYWRERLNRARAMGLNTIFSYIYWNELEPIQGKWLNTGPNDIAKFFSIAQDEGLQIVLRPGPYICGEREWGGFPFWLANIPGMVVRTYNQPFLGAAKSYIERLANDLRPLQVLRGGPILMVQVENEYGSYDNNHQYTSALKDILKANFANGTVFYTNDGGVDWTLEGGSVPGVLAEIDGDAYSGFKSRAEYITDPSQLGPLLDGEYYTWAPDQWGPYNPHNTTVGNPQDVQGFVKDLDYVLGNESASISVYMFHGGTNFGFSNGALWQNRTTVFTTSYDYAAPLDESGRTTDLYFTLRETIQKYVPAGSIPSVEPNAPRSSIPSFDLTPSASLFEPTILGRKRTSKSPETMEALGQAYGYTLYEHVTNTSISGFLQPGDRARDRVLIYVNGVRAGIIDSQYHNPPNVTISLKTGDKLQLLVENLGRVDYWSRGNKDMNRNYVIDPYKGVKGDVSIGGMVVSGWEMYSLPLEDVSSVSSSNSTPPRVQYGVPPLFYRGSFDISRGAASKDPAELDTYLAVPNGLKGVVWVNGFNLGRYWFVGPQQSLYLPGTVLKEGKNDVLVLELEPGLRGNSTMTAYGEKDRSWGNNPDIDCLNCV